MCFVSKTITFCVGTCQNTRQNPSCGSAPHVGHSAVRLDVQGKDRTKTSLRRPLQLQYLSKEPRHSDDLSYFIDINDYDLKHPCPVDERVFFST